MQFKNLDNDSPAKFKVNRDVKINKGEQIISKLKSLVSKESEF